MKKIKIATICVICAVLILALGSCSLLVEAFEDEKTRGYTELVIDLIISEDLDSAYAVFSDICTKDDFADIFYEMKNLLKEVKSYDLRLLSVNRTTGTVNGTSYSEISSVYEMTSNSGKYIIDVKANSLYPKLSSFYVANFEETNYYFTGTVTSMKNANALQWIFLLSNLLTIGITVFALIDCCRHKVKLKALWIIIILTCLFSFGITFSLQNFSLNLYLGWLTSYSAVIIYGGGMNTVRFLIPVGSAVYFILRHWIIKRPVPTTMHQTANCSQPQEIPSAPEAYHEQNGTSEEDQSTEEN